MFNVLAVRQRPAFGASGPAVYLTEDRWDDYTFQTMFFATYVAKDGSRVELGNVKIAHYGMGSERATTKLAKQFDALGDSFFSVGQDEEYYKALATLPSQQGVEVLRSLRDFAFDTAIFETARQEDVTKLSLLREISASDVLGPLNRAAHGLPPLTPYKFDYVFPDGSNRLNFDVIPDENPPSNIHVLIGRNGVGKTRVLTSIARAIAGNTDFDEVGRVVVGDDETDGPERPNFANVVSVSFSAFDPFVAVSDGASRRDEIKYFYVGLKRPTDDGDVSLKGEFDLGQEFATSLEVCLRDSRRSRWDRAIRTMESDPNFRDADLRRLLAIWDDAPWYLEDEALRAFSSLSSGHSVVLLMLTRLVEKVSERTLVLLDEPEAHLHPPLLSAFVRALSDLLRDRNGVAVVATHSPVVLQEVPSNCVWVINRSGDVWHVVQPSVETFGENVGVLTHEIFGLAVQQAGFYDLVRKAADELHDYDAVADQFGQRLGGEAAALLRTYLFVTGREGQ